MVLYFLQQRNPPVIPVLQEVGSENEGMKIDALFLQAKYEKCGILGSGGINEIWGLSNQ